MLIHKRSAALISAAIVTAFLHLHEGFAQAPISGSSSWGRPQSLVEIPPHRSISCVLFSNGGTTIVTVQNETNKPGSLQLWDSQTGTLLWTSPTPAKQVFAFSHDDKTLAVTSLKGFMVLVDAESGQVRPTFTPAIYESHVAAFSPDGTVVATDAPDVSDKGWNSASWVNNPREVDLCDVGTGKTLRSLKGHRGAVFDVTFSLDGTLLASASWDKTVKLWDAKTGQLLRTLEHGKDTWGISSVAFSPDGKVVATSRGLMGEGGKRVGGEITFWDVHTGALQRTLRNQRPEEVVQIGETSTIAFSPDGNVLTSAGTDETIIIWDVISGTKKTTLQATAPSRSFKYAMRFVPEGLKLGSRTDDGRIQITLWPRR